MNQRFGKNLGSIFYHITLESRNFDHTSSVAMLHEPPLRDTTLHRRNCHAPKAPLNYLLIYG